MRKELLACGLLAVAALSPQANATDAPRVVVSIKPIHALVAAVMQDAGRPTLLVATGASPHAYSLKPSEARALQQADVVVWVGEELETFLVKPLAALPRNARVLELAEAPGVKLLPYRETGPWQEPAHAQPAPAKAAGKTHDHDHDHPQQHGQGDEHGHGEEHGGSDPHIWLDVGNAKAIVAAAAAVLADADPARAAVYDANRVRTQARLDGLDATLRAELAPVTGRPYIAFHDAYQYLERRYGLTNAGSITVNPDRQPSAQRIAAIRRKIRESGAVCVFSEPQFEPKLVQTLIEGTAVRTGVLDADGGIGVPEGPDAYFTIMRSLAAALRGCLAPAS